jgi:hypothetical protein
VFVKAGSIDDPAIVQPTHQSWVVSSVPWSRIENDLEAFSRGRE